MRKRAIPVKGLFNGRDCFYLDPPKLIVGLIFYLLWFDKCLSLPGRRCGLWAGILIVFAEGFRLPELFRHLQGLGHGFHVMDTNDGNTGMGAAACHSSCAPDSGARLRLIQYVPNEPFA